MNIINRYIQKPSDLQFLNLFTSLVHDYHINGEFSIQVEGDQHNFATYKSRHNIVVTASTVVCIHFVIGDAKNNQKSNVS